MDETFKQEYNQKQNGTHSVEIHVRILRHVVVKYYVDSLDVHPASKQIRRYQYSLLEILELLVSRESAEERKNPV